MLWEIPGGSGEVPETSVGQSRSSNLPQLGDPEVPTEVATSANTLSRGHPNPIVMIYHPFYFFFKFLAQGIYMP